MGTVNRWRGGGNPEIVRANLGIAGGNPWMSSRNLKADGANLKIVGANPWIGDVTRECTNTSVNNSHRRF
jgi:hypothetical protein